MSNIVEDLLDTIDRALAMMKKRPEARLDGDIDNLLRVKHILEGLDPEEVEALLEDEEDSEEE